MKRNRMLFLLGLGAVLVLVCVWLGMPYENEVHDNPSKQIISTKPKSKAVAFGGGVTGMPTPPAANKESEFPPLEVSEGFYRDNPSLVDTASGISLNDNLLGGLGITDRQKIILSNSLISVIQRLNAKTAVTLHPGVSRLSPLRAQKTAYKIQPKDTSLIDQAKREIKDSLIVILGEGKGTALFQRVALAADGDPYLRGFGANTLVIYITPDSSRELRNFRWEFQVLAEDGTTVSSGDRNSPTGIPSPFQDLFHTEVLESGN